MVSLITAFLPVPVVIIDLITHQPVITRQAIQRIIASISAKDIIRTITR